MTTIIQSWNLSRIFPEGFLEKMAAEGTVEAVDNITRMVSPLTKEKMVDIMQLAAKHNRFDIAKLLHEKHKFPLSPCMIVFVLLHQNIEFLEYLRTHGYLMGLSNMIHISTCDFLEESYKWCTKRASDEEIVKAAETVYNEMNRARKYDCADWLMDRVEHLL